MSELATSHLAAFVPLSIERLRDRGGPTESDVLWAQAKMQQIRDGAGGHAIVFYDAGQTARETALLTEVLAILSFVPGGVRFAELHFDAERPAFALTLDEKLFAALEPFRAAMDRIEQQSRRLEDVSEQERARLRELEVLLVQAANRGDTTQQALLEAEMDAILLKPQPVIVEPIGEVRQQALWESA